MAFLHGINVSEPVDGVRPILEKSTAVIGLVATATAAIGPATATLDAAFPLNTPVLVTDVRGAIGKAGSGGTLRTALEAIADQGSPIIVVVRVAVGVANGQQTAPQAQSLNTIGTVVDGVYTGMQALLTAESRLGVRPRILGAPGLDTPPVTAAFAVVAKQLRGFVYAYCFGVTTVAAALTYREDYGAREVMLIWPEIAGGSGRAVGAALGLRAMLDETVGWHKSLSNVAVANVPGLTREVRFDIRDMSTDAGLLNQAGVTTIVRMNGYRFWGNRTTSDEPLFAFETAVRTGQAIQDAIADGLIWAIDKTMTLGLVRDIEETINRTLRRWVTEGRLIGGRAWFDPGLNPSEQLASGKLVIDYDYTPVAPLEGLQLNQRITGKYYAGFGDELAG